MDKVTLDHFEFMILVNIKTNSARMITNPSDATRPAPKDYPDYENGIRMFCEHFVIKEQRANIMEQMSLKSIINELKDKPSYVIILTAYDQNRVGRIKRLSYSYLDEGAGQVLVTEEDVTELMQTEREKTEKLTAALEQATKANASKSEFLSNMSHDMRTPMNAILSFSRMALEEHPNREVIDEYIHKIYESGNYLLGLINDVLDMAKIESKKMELNLETVDTRTLFESIVSTAKPMLDTKNITFIFETKGIISGKAAVVDKLRLQQVIVNLLSNAAKFTPNYGRVECIIEMLHYDGMYAEYRVIIQDNGCGISPDFLEKVFLPFEQEHKTRELNQSGTGLGLAIVKKLVDLMGGTIKINSTEGVGTEVILQFTTKLVDVSEIQRSSDKSLPTEFDFSGKRVLLCEDHPLNQQIICKLLAKKGFLVDVASNGAEGVQRFDASRQWYYDAVLMDIRMPVMDGFQSTQAIRRLDREDASIIPILAITANAFDDDIQKSLDAGMNAHLAKPVNPIKLYETLYSLLSMSAKEEKPR